MTTTSLATAPARADDKPVRNRADHADACAAEIAAGASVAAVGAELSVLIRF